MKHLRSYSSALLAIAIGGAAACAPASPLSDEGSSTEPVLLRPNPTTRPPTSSVSLNPAATSVRLGTGTSAGAGTGVPRDLCADCPSPNICIVHGTNVECSPPAGLCAGCHYPDVCVIHGSTAQCVHSEADNQDAGSDECVPACPEGEACLDGQCHAVGLGDAGMFVPH